MKIYWSSASIPELAELPKNERRRLWRVCYWQALKGSWSPWAALITIAAFSSWGSLLQESWGRIIGSALGIFMQTIELVSWPWHSLLPIPL